MHGKECVIEHAFRRGNNDDNDDNVNGRRESFFPTAEESAESWMAMGVDSDDNLKPRDLVPDCRLMIQVRSKRHPVPGSCFGAVVQWCSGAVVQGCGGEPEEWDARDVVGLRKSGEARGGLLDAGTRRTWLVGISARRRYQMH